MNNNEYLNEQNYQSTNKKIKLISAVILLLGLSLGGFLLYTGITKISNVNDKYSTDNINKKIEKVTTDLDKVKEERTAKTIEIKTRLEIRKNELKDKGITYSNVTKYDEGEAYELKLITNALDTSFNYCSFDEYKNNEYTKEYCSYSNASCNFNEDNSEYCALVKELNSLKSNDPDFDKSFESSKYILFIMFGVFAIMASLMISSSIYVFSKRRQILAYGVQESMPIAQEGINEMGPTLGNLAKNIASGINDAKKK